jgi:hypothetical protein
LSPKLDRPTKDPLEALPIAQNMRLRRSQTGQTKLLVLGAGEEASL